MTPSPSTAPTDNGIGRVLKALGEYLPAYGVEFTQDAQHADLVVFNAGTALGKRVDVLMCHGLYWNDLEHYQFSRSNNEANFRIIAAARRAKIITVPSDWVAEAFRRDMRIEPEVIGHGLDVQEWSAGQPHGGYILWNKNRPTDVCDPSPAWKIAERGLSVVSTFGPVGKTIPNLQVTGNMPFERMKPIIEQAEIYLATAPETFGIGTLEAMVCGIPVLGFDWCGTRDLVKHKETGWLCPIGDIDGLLEGYYWLKEHRDEIGANARAFASHFAWPDIVDRYYEVYQRASVPDAIGVSIVITNYNYAQWVGDAIRSCLDQKWTPDEIIVVDDGSTDDSLEVLKEFEGRIKLIAQSNQGVAAARNNGIQVAKSPLIVCLDADDMLAPEYLMALMPSMIKDRGLGIAYPGLKFLRPDGSDSGYNQYKPFSWEIQARAAVPPPTCIPSGSLFRKSMWARCGGYKQKYAPGEDAEFWTHGLSLGFTAEMVTSEALFWYRGHEGSASRTRKYVAIDDNKPWMRDRIYPMGAPSFYVPSVRSYLNPLVSVIVPVGPGHETLVIDAIESVIGQNVREWELIVIDDTGNEAFGPLIKKRYPFVRLLSTPGALGAGHARNLGIEKAKGKFVLFLDADDWLRSDCLDVMLQEHAHCGRYIFSNLYIVQKGETIEKQQHDYDRELYFTEIPIDIKQDDGTIKYIPAFPAMHSVTALVPTEWAREVGGFDPSLIGWEEYDFYMKLAVKGYCGFLVRAPLFYYRAESGTRRFISFTFAKELVDEFKKRFQGVEMAGCCGNSGNSVLEAKRALGLIPRESPAAPELPNEVRLEFTKPFLGAISYQVNGRVYYGAQDGLHRFINAPREDVDSLVKTGAWRVITPGTQAQPEPEPVQSNQTVYGNRR